MKKIFFTCLILVLGLLVAFLTLRGCSHWLLNTISDDYVNRDWFIELHNGYEIVKVNSDSIILINNVQNSTSNIVIPEYINAYRYNKQYLEILCARDGPNDLLGVDSEKDKYYLIEFEKHFLHGPYTKEEFIGYCSKLSIPDLGDWITTMPRPQNAMFDK